MRRAAVLWLVLATGCSNAPIADILDHCKPGRLPAEHGPPYGGVGPADHAIGVMELPAEPPPAPLYSMPSHASPVGPGVEISPPHDGNVVIMPN